MRLAARQVLRQRTSLRQLSDPASAPLAAVNEPCEPLVIPLQAFIICTYLHFPMTCDVLPIAHCTGHRTL